jgi:uncharacterized protein YndB with AHSA1/START domain
MNRKTFLKTLAFAAATTASGGAVPAFRARRAATEYIGELSAPPEAVFPLLCPVREYEWLDGWTGEMVYSESGVAEENCIFRTPLGPSTWNVDRYEPPKRTAFTVVAPEQVCRLTITLEPTAAGGTRVTWKRIFTGLNEAGNAKVNSWSVDIDRALMSKIDYFLKTGKMAREG